MKKVLFVAVALFFVCMQSAYPQITTNELPVSIQRGLGDITKGKTKGVIDLPVPDIKKLLQEDSLKQEKNPYGFQRTAVSIPIVIDINKDGIWSILEDGAKLWQMEIHAEKALALDFVFSKFWLPKEGKFFLFNPSTKETIGAITSKYIFGDRDKPQRFSTGVLKGDKIILEYYQPTGENELPVIKVEKAYYTYIFAPNFLSTSTCSYEVNVNCSEGSSWQLEKNAVALVYCKDEDESGWCSGSLLNNTQNNLAPLFLTANHCVGTKDAINDNDLSDWVFYWGYELENCSSITLPNYYTTIGATLLANNSYSDFALLQLQQDPLNIPGYIPYYLGWDASGNSGTGGVCIHHPNGDVKKISTYSCTPQTVSFNSSPSFYWGVQWDATTNGHGITEHGSSGSTLINNDHRVIGQLSGGSAKCTNLIGTSKYGKLSVSWTGNSNSDYRRRLDYWLNPYGTNTQTINGLYPYNLSGPSYICSSSTGVFSISNLPSCYNVNWYLSDGFGPTAPTLQISGNSCTINNNLSKSYMGVLHADIYYQGTLLKTLLESVVLYSGFYGTYSINGGSTQQINSSNSVIWVNHGDLVEIKSPNLVAKNVSYSVVNPYLWQYYTFSGALDVGYPSTAGNNPIVISVQNNTNYSSCDNSHQITLMPTSVLPHYLLKTTGGNGCINVELITERNEEALKKLRDLPVPVQIDETPSWILEVIDANLGEKVLTKEITGNSTSVSLPAKSKGVFVVRATIGKEVLTEKIQVK